MSRAHGWSFVDESIQMKSRNKANEPMQQIAIPSALLSCLLLIPLRGQESRQKQVVIGHRGR